MWCKILPALWNHHHLALSTLCTWPSGLLAFNGYIHAGRASSNASWVDNDEVLLD
jgi:hypothetical protein